MKPRKNSESDADYIRRLEACVSDIIRHNDRMKKDHKRIYESLIPAAQKTGFVLQAAADVAGVAGRPDIVATVDALEKLGSAIWHDDHIDIPKIGPIPYPAKAKPSDLEMMLKSKVEEALCQLEPWEGVRIVEPMADDASIEEAAHEIHDALSSLEMSRCMLRLDLRAAMYERCFQQIGQAANLLWRKTIDRTTPRKSHDGETEVFDDSHIPF